MWKQGRTPQCTDAKPFSSSENAKKGVFSALRRTWKVAWWRCLVFQALSVPGDRDSLALDFRAAQSCFSGSQMWIEDAGLRVRGRFPSAPSPLLSRYPITPHCLLSLTDSWLKFKALGILVCSGFIEGGEGMTKDKCEMIKLLVPGWSEG